MIGLSSGKLDWFGFSSVWIGLVCFNGSGNFEAFYTSDGLDFSKKLVWFCSTELDFEAFTLRTVWFGFQENWLGSFQQVWILKHLHFGLFEISRNWFGFFKRIGRLVFSGTWIFYKFSTNGFKKIEAD